MKPRWLALLLFVFAITLSAQTFRGGIEGTIVDQTGAYVPGVQVTITSIDTGLVRNAITDTAGNFVATELPLGSYKVVVAKPGFGTQTAEKVRVDVASMSRVNFTLRPGEVKQEVIVTGAVPLVDTSENNLGGTIELRQVEALPVNGRDFTKLLILVPGATGDNSGGADSPGSFGLFSLNGNRGRSNNYMLDGTDMNDGYRNLPAINQGGVFGTPATVLPVDALAQIPVISNFEAEYGRNSGAVVNMVTKSGTNTVHGSVYEFVRDGAMGARNYFNLKPGPKNDFRNNQFGGSIGGPIVKDRTFYFASYEGQRESGGLTFANLVPTQQQMAAANCGGALPAGLNPVTVNIACTLQPWGPIAKLPATGANGGSALQTVNFTNRVDSMIAKIDQHIGSGGDLLSGRFFFGDSDQSFPLGLLGGAAVPGYNTVTPTRVQILSLSYTHVFSPKTLLEVRGGWNRFNESFFPQDHAYDTASNLGLNNVSSSLDRGLPLIKIGTPAVSGGGVTYTPVGANASVPRGRIDTNWQFFTNATHITGKHSFKWGYEFRRTFINGFFDAGYRGVLSFADFDAFLQGDISGGHQMSGNSKRYTYQNSHAWYFQDAWRVTPRLTANLGVRWDYFGVIGEKNGNMSLFDPALALADAPVVVKRVNQLYPKDFKNFAPRLSLAYDLRGNAKTVLRAGYGIFYDTFSQDFFVGQLPWPTFNSGPAYNYLGANDPWSIQESYNWVPGLGVTSGPCAAGQVAVPKYTGFCASPTFDPSFGNDTFTVSQKIRTPYVQNWNFNVEQALGDKISAQIGYIGSKGTRLFRYLDINQVCPGPTACGSIAAGSNAFGFPSSMGFGYLLEFQSSSSSVYHSLQTSLQMRNFHGVSSVLNYTWSHSIDDASDGQDYVPNATQPDNSFNTRAERANSNFDQRNRFTWNLTYEFPNPVAMKWLSNGWEIDSVVTISSGNPYNLSAGTESFANDFNGTGEFYGRPDWNPSLAFAGTGGLNILNLKAFKVPCDWDPVLGCTGGQHMGSLPRNAFRGPSFRAFDFSVVKNTKLTERVTMQLRADFFNLLNHPNLANPLWPSYQVDMAHFGLDDSGHGKGFLQPTTTPDVGLGNPFLGGGGPRGIQLAARFTF